MHRRGAAENACWALGVAAWACAACTSAPPAPSDSYPQGPYGVDPPATIADLRFGTLDGGAFSLDQVYRGPERVVVLYGTAPWCFTCAAEVDWLNAKAAVPSSGVRPIAVVLEDDQLNRADAATAAQFVSQYGVTFETLVDPDGALDPFRQSNAIPVNLVIDTRTMRIALHEYGFLPNDLDAAIASVLESDGGT